MSKGGKDATGRRKLDLGLASLLEGAAEPVATLEAASSQNDSDLVVQESVDAGFEYSFDPGSQIGNWQGIEPFGGSNPGDTPPPWLAVDQSKQQPVEQMLELVGKEAESRASNSSQSLDFDAADFTSSSASEQLSSESYDSGGSELASLNHSVDPIVQRLDRLLAVQAWSGLGDLAERSLNTVEQQDVRGVIRCYWVIAQLKRQLVPATVLVGPTLAAFDEIEGGVGGGVSSVVKDVVELVAKEVAASLGQVGDSLGQEAILGRLKAWQSSRSWSKWQNLTGSDDPKRSQSAASRAVHNGARSNEDQQSRLGLSEKRVSDGLVKSEPKAALFRQGSFRWALMGALVCVGVYFFWNSGLRQISVGSSEQAELRFHADKVGAAAAGSLELIPPPVERLSRVGRLDTLLYGMEQGEGVLSPNGAGAGRASAIQERLQAGVNAADRENGAAVAEMVDVARGVAAVSGETVSGSSGQEADRGAPPQDRAVAGELARPPLRDQPAPAVDSPATDRGTGKGEVNTNYPLESPEIANKVSAPIVDPVPGGRDDLNNGRPLDHFPKEFSSDMVAGGERFFRVVARTQVRPLPSFSNNGLDYLQPGDRILVVGRDGSWLKVRSTSGRIGYVLAQDAEPEKGRR